MNDQVSLWDQSTPQPLAARLRPDTIDGIVGQKHLLGPGKILRTIRPHIGHVGIGMAPLCATGRIIHINHLSIRSRHRLQVKFRIGRACTIVRDTDAG